MQTVACEQAAALLHDLIEISRNTNYDAINKFHRDKKIKSNLHYTRDITPKRVTSGGPISAAEQHNSEETSQR